MAVLLVGLPDLGHDQQWLLLAAQRMGTHLNPYTATVLESNPPLAIWLSAIVLALANLLHLPLTLTFKLTVTALAACIALVSARLLRRFHPTLTKPQLWLLTFAFIVVFGVVPARDFGQRDHILALLILPYLVASASCVFQVPTAPSLTLGLPPLSPGQRTLVTLTAALGLALKPHHSLIPLAVELSLLLMRTPRRNLPPPSKVLSTKAASPHTPPALISTEATYPPTQPEVISTGVSDSPIVRDRVERPPIPAFAPPPIEPAAPRYLEPTLFLLAALAYYASIRLFAPTYLTDILPLLRDTYWSFGHLTLPQLLLQSVQLHALAALVLCLFLLSGARSPLTAILVAAASAATLAYYLQGTGWYYQQLPALSLFAFALASQLIARAGTVARTRWLTPATLALALLALALTATFSGFLRAPHGHLWQLQQPQPTPDPTFFANLPPGAPVATLTTSVDDTVPPAFRYRLTLAQRYPHLWLLPALLRQEPPPDAPGSSDFTANPGVTPAHRIPPARLATLVRLQDTMMVEDLNRWHPVLILVERCQDPVIRCQALEDRHDDLLAFFLRDPAFAAIFAHYHLLRTSGPYAAYALAK